MRTFFQLQLLEACDEQSAPQRPYVAFEQTNPSRVVGFHPETVPSISSFHEITLIILGSPYSQLGIGSKKVRKLQDIAGYLQDCLHHQGGSGKAVDGVLCGPPKIKRYDLSSKICLQISSNDESLSQSLSHS